ncbi:hypothetical protein J437_LFUL009618 [Ladona fulva]|uniref:Helitron helicase-like domain-containing protein n=1 Tax=Ladona fulva TaxID=123851 RepID=A0A8K0KAZ1_LADFU|nr:hypothetical protein J437_LFUL009618 [Ladona fulva]
MRQFASMLQYKSALTAIRDEYFNPGSPRNMRERCCDAMSIFGKIGAPDLFVTFTANPRWPEVIDNLLPEEHQIDLI